MKGTTELQSTQKQTKSKFLDFSISSKCKWAESSNPKAQSGGTTTTRIMAQLYVVFKRLTSALRTYIGSNGKIHSMQIGNKRKR